MTRICYRIAVLLFDLAARIYPLHCLHEGQAHHVGDRWLVWKVGREDNRAEA